MKRFIKENWVMLTVVLSVVFTYAFTTGCKHSPPVKREDTKEFKKAPRD